MRRRSRGRTIRNKPRQNPTDSATVVPAFRSGSPVNEAVPVPPPAASAVTSASTVQAMMSATAAVARVIDPSGVRNMPRSDRMRANNREGRGRHRRPEEQHKRQLGNHTTRHDRVLLVQPAGHHRSEGEWQRHRGGGDNRRRPLPAFDQTRVQFDPDHEHEHDQPDLGDHHQVGTDLQRKQRLGDAVAEKGRAEQDTGEHLADHNRLAQTAEQRARQARDQQDDGDRQQDASLIYARGGEERDHGNLRRTHREVTQTGRNRFRSDHPVGVTEFGAGASPAGVRRSNGGSAKRADLGDCGSAAGFAAVLRILFR